MGENRLAFTKAALEALPVPEKGKRRMYHDAGPRSVQGLCVEVLGTGRKTYYVYMWGKGKPQKVRIGSFPDMPVDEARRRAAKEVAAIKDGADPQAERRTKRGEMTFEDLFKWYMKNHAKPRKKERSWREDEKNFDRYLQDLAPRPISAITRGDIRQLHAGIRAGTVGTHDEKKRGKGATAGLYAANRALALVRSVLNRAIAEEIFPGPNPAMGVSLFREQSRDRRLTPTEVAKFLEEVAAEPNETLRDFVHLLLLTGARKGNVMAMRWDEIDFSERTWRIPETKNGKPQTIPLEEAELVILRRRKGEAASPCVFPAPKSASGHLENPSKAWGELRKRAGVPDLRLHDLRRTLGSFMVDTGSSLAVIGQTLHHQSQATTAIYARLSLDPIREAKRRAHGAMRGEG